MRQRHDETLHGEEAIIALLAPLAEGFPGAFGLKDDCALITPAPDTELVLKTDPDRRGRALPRRATRRRTSPGRRWP